MKLVNVGIVFTILLTGCTLFSPMGVAKYSIEPSITDSGEVMCCEVKVYNTKDIANVHVEMRKSVDGSIEMYLYEEGVDASTPNLAGAEANRATAEAMQGLIKLIPGTVQ